MIKNPVTVRDFARNAVEEGLDLIYGAGNESKSELLLSYLESRFFQVVSTSSLIEPGKIYATSSKP